MKVERIMSRNVRTIDARDTLDKAASAMKDANCGSVPVVDHNKKVAGMLTDRDICMAALAQEKLLREIPVSSAMSGTLWSCGPQDNIADAEETMRSHHIHRLPVLDDKGQLLGVLSLSDIAQEAAREERQKPQRRQVAFAEVGHTLGAISENYGRATEHA